MDHEDSDDDYIPEPEDENGEKPRVKREKTREKIETEKPPKMRKLKQSRSSASGSMTTRSSQKKSIKK